MKAQALKRDLSEIKNSMSEINNLASMGRSQQAIGGNSAMSMSKLHERYEYIDFSIGLL